MGVPFSDACSMLVVLAFGMNILVGKAEKAKELNTLVISNERQSQLQRFLKDDATSRGRCSPYQFRIIDEAYGLPTGVGLDWATFESTLASLQANTVVAAEVAKVPCFRLGCCKMLMHFRPNTTDSRVFKQVFRDDFFSPIYKQLHHMQPKYILDGGGNVGFSAALFAMVFPEAQIITVEPDKSNYAILKMNTHRFHNVHAINAGLWDKQAHIVFMAALGEWGNMFQEVSGPQQGSVYGVTITHLLQRFGFPRLDFAKIDIEGAEARVFSPTANLEWLDSAKLISMELHDRMAHFYGLKNVSAGLMQTMAARPEWSSFVDGEHTFWQHAAL